MLTCTRTSGLIQVQRSFPTSYSGCLAFGAAILVAQGVSGLAHASWRVPRPLIDIKRLIVPLLLAVSIIAYVLIVPAIGFLAVSLLFSVGWAAGLAVQDHRFAVRPLLMSAGGSAVIAIGIFSCL